MSDALSQARPCGALPYRALPCRPLPCRAWPPRPEFARVNPRKYPISFAEALPGIR